MTSKQDEIKKLAQLKRHYIRSKRTSKWTIGKKQRVQLHHLALKYPSIAELPLRDLDRIATE